jgi:glycosyltransferase involved in cell wall biosynthesis
MDFDIVIATRNRLPALEISLPLVLSQSRLPRRLVIVDASDDYEEVSSTVRGIVACSNAQVDLRVLQSDPGSALQRNVGLALATSPVVLMPDDDALWFPRFSESIMEVYERDREALVGGVGGAESASPPPGALHGGDEPYRMEARDRVQSLVGRFLDLIEYRLFPDPIFVEGNERTGARPRPDWFDKEETRLAPALPGFLMSFRTDLIRRCGFDTILGRYALFEDYDASLDVLGDHLLVEARKARVFHYRAPQKRLDGAGWGAVQILNRAYVVCKHSLPRSRARRRLRAYSCYKLLRYALQGQTRYGRQRAAGAMRALGLLGRLIEAPPDSLSETYLRLREKCS